MEEFSCCKPAWLSPSDLLDLPCGCEEALAEDIPCSECCWFMPVSTDTREV